MSTSTVLSLCVIACTILCSRIHAQSRGNGLTQRGSMFHRGLRPIVVQAGRQNQRSTTFNAPAIAPVPSGSAHSLGRFRPRLRAVMQPRIMPGSNGQHRAMVVSGNRRRRPARRRGLAASLSHRQNLPTASRLTGSSGQRPSVSRSVSQRITIGSGPSSRIGNTARMSAQRNQKQTNPVSSNKRDINIIQRNIVVLNSKNKNSTKTIEAASKLADQVLQRGPLRNNGRGQQLGQKQQGPGPHQGAPVSSKRGFDRMAPQLQNLNNAELTLDRTIPSHRRGTGPSSQTGHRSTGAHGQSGMPGPSGHMDHGVSRNSPIARSKFISVVPSTHFQHGSLGHPPAPSEFVSNIPSGTLPRTGEKIMPPYHVNTSSSFNPNSHPGHASPSLIHDGKHGGHANAQSGNASPKSPHVGAHIGNVEGHLGNSAHIPPTDNKQSQNSTSTVSKSSVVSTQGGKQNTLTKSKSGSGSPFSALTNNKGMIHIDDLLKMTQQFLASSNTVDQKHGNPLNKSTTSSKSKSTTSQSGNSGNTTNSPKPVTIQEAIEMIRGSSVNDILSTAMTNPGQSFRDLIAVAPAFGVAAKPTKENKLLKGIKTLMAHTGGAGLSFDYLERLGLTNTNETEIIKTGNAEQDRMIGDLLKEVKKNVMEEAIENLQKEKKNRLQAANLGQTIVVPQSKVITIVK